MSIQSNSASTTHLQLAIFRLSDVCVSVQDKMDGFLATAALEKSVGVEAAFAWLRKRRVRICLLSDYGDADTQLLLGRLGWSVGDGGTVHYVVTEQGMQPDPIGTAIERAGLEGAKASFTVFDTPRLLLLANQARVHFNLAVCNARHPYATLATAPHHGMLDSLLQLPTFLLDHLPAPTHWAGPRVQSKSGGPQGPVSTECKGGRTWVGLPRLRLPYPLSGR